LSIGLKLVDRVLCVAQVVNRLLVVLEGVAFQLYCQRAVRTISGNIDLDGTGELSDAVADIIVVEVKSEASQPVEVFDGLREREHIIDLVVLQLEIEVRNITEALERSGEA